MNYMDNKPQIKLLLVDDREDNLISIEAILENEGYILRKATSGRQALKILLKEQDFTLILMDVQMPELDGFETAALIYERDKLKHVPIIFITAHNYGEAKIYQAYEAGAVDYIYKPINPELLKAKVSVFVELYQKNHQLLEQEQKLISINKNLEKEIKDRRISEHKVSILNRQLLENIQHLENSNAELARFAYVASHDLQEPLRKIRTFGDRLLEKYRTQIDTEGQDYIDRMQKAAKRMQLLIDDILMFSRISFNNEDFNEVDLNEVMAEVLTDLEISIEQKRAQIKVQPLPKVRVVPALFRQLFQNLISNSLKFARKDTDPVIEVSAMEKEIEGKSFWNIELKDNGIGFEDKYADQIFGMFQRLHGHFEYEGTGIGLAICKKIIDHHLGAITASGKVNQGALFTITIPVNIHSEELNILTPQHFEEGN